MFSFFLSLQYYEMSYGLNVEMHKQVIFDALIVEKKKGYIFCFEDCSDLLWEKNVLMIENFAKILGSL